MPPVRRLPHVYPRDHWLFLTWRLHGAVRSSQFPPPAKASAGRTFVWRDRQLDLARTGPMFLRQDPIANLVVASLYRGAQLGHYDLASFVVMPNHVHVLLLPKVLPSQLLKALKGATAHDANRLLGRIGEPFWQHESYDHCVRDDPERSRIESYIESNPVKAGLVARAEDYRWSSAWSGPGVGMSADAARTSACATEPAAAPPPAPAALFSSVSDAASSPRD